MTIHKVLKKKHDGSVYTEHMLELWEETESGIIGLNPIGDPWYKRAEDYTFYQQYGTLLYFPKGEWYNLLYYFDQQDNNMEKLYINLATPYQWEAGQVTYIDYDIDLILRGDHQLVIDDIDEWQARKPLYPTEIVTKIESTMNELISELLAGQFQPLFEMRKRNQSLVINPK